MRDRHAERDHSRMAHRGWELPAPGERQALSVLLAARRFAINASTEAQQQVFSLVIAAPEPIRVRFRGQKLAAILNTAANLRVHASWDTETTSTVVALRTLARRAHAMLKEARELQKAIVAIIRSWRPDLLEEFGVGPIVAATVLCAWSHPGRIRSEAAFAMLAGVAPIPANSGQVTTRFRLNRYGDRQASTTHCTPWSRAESSISQPPATTSPAAPPKVRQPRSNAVVLATSPATLPFTGKRSRRGLTKHRSVAPPSTCASRAGRGDGKMGAWHRTLGWWHWASVLLVSRHVSQRERHLRGRRAHPDLRAHRGDRTRDPLRRLLSTDATGPSRRCREDRKSVV